MKLVPSFLKKPSENKLSLIATLYFMSGIIFALFYAYYYRWPAVGYFSPGFYMVIFTWPLQAIGFVRDILYYGLAGKPI